LLALLAPRTFIGKVRNPILLVVSVLAIYWLQPALPIRGLDFWLPTATLLISILGWLITSEPDQRSLRANGLTLGLLVATVLLLAASRLFLKAGILTPSRPPQIQWVALALIAAAGLFFLLGRIKNRKSWSYTLLIAGLLILFVILKFPQVTLWVSAGLRSLAGQKPELATSVDLRWLGFSYIAFRLIHTLRDRQLGRLSGATLQEYLIYLLFFPAFTAGPIDRVERFIKDLRAPYDPQAHDLGECGKRLVLGLFKKFVVADALAMMALSSQNAAQVHSAGYLWLLVYAYAFEIFFDFSGYTDIAIGLGRWLGIKLPENFNHPYLKPNLTQFWNNWHMTLTTWFRSYFFNPLTRSLRGGKKPLPVPLVIFITQILTMVLIGLWHA
jgi:D-alanyl-lipoteichoic acid acyltransferase DltB (MBOAT superfamily)